LSIKLELCDNSFAITNESKKIELKKKTTMILHKKIEIANKKSEREHEMRTTGCV